MNKLKKLLLLLLILFLGATVWYSDFTDPSILWETPENVGNNSQMTLLFEDQGKGLRRVQLTLRQGDTSHELLAHTYSMTALPWQSGPSTREVQITTKEWASEYGIKDGPVQLVATVEDQASLWLFSRTVEQTKAIRFDPEENPG